MPDADDDESRHAEADVNSDWAETILTYLNLGIVGRVYTGADTIQIELLSKYRDSAHIIRIVYATELHHTLFSQPAPRCVFEVKYFLPASDVQWDILQKQWQAVHDRWTGPKVWVLAVNRLEVGSSNGLSLAHPIVLQEMSRLQEILDRYIRSQRGDQSGLIHASRRLGHLIKAQNKNWLNIMPL